MERTFYHNYYYAGEERENSQFFAISIILEQKITSIDSDNNILAAKETDNTSWADIRLFLIIPYHLDRVDKHASQLGMVFYYEGL